MKLVFETCLIKLGLNKKPKQLGLKFMIETIWVD